MARINKPEAATPGPMLPKQLTLPCANQPHQRCLDVPSLHRHLCLRHLLRLRHGLHHQDRQRGSPNNLLRPHLSHRPIPSPMPGTKACGGVCFRSPQQQPQQWPARLLMCASLCCQRSNGPDLLNLLQTRLPPAFVCMNSAATHALVPCGHRIVCNGCASTVMEEGGTKRCHVWPQNCDGHPAYICLSIKLGGT